jgi:predicted RND superfamily exporter protein
MRWGKRHGQTLAEYAIALATLIAVIAMAAIFFYTFKEWSSRVLELVASEYP